jgi:hypothetical protein
MKRNKQCLSSIPPISTKRTITSDLNWTHWTQKDHSMWRWKSRSWLEQQAHKCGGVKSINGIYCKLNIWTNICNTSIGEPDVKPSYYYYWTNILYKSLLYKIYINVELFFLLFAEWFVESTDATLYTHGLTWNDANKYCKSIGQNLVTIDKYHKSKLLLKSYSDNSYQSR